MPIENKKIQEALKELRSRSEKRNFNQSVDLMINLREVDVKAPEGRIQEIIELPHAISKNVSVCVLATGDMALRARKAGADMVLQREDIDSMANDKKKQREIAKKADFFIAEAPLMPLIGKVLGPILGPRGKMPTPLPPTANIEDAIERHRRMTGVRVRGQPILQSRIGTEDMTDEQLIDNIQAVLRRVEAKLKRGTENIRSIYLKTTMGSPIKVSK